MPQHLSFDATPLKMARHPGWRVRVSGRFFVWQMTLELEM
jgi:hypothetical protein